MYSSCAIPPVCRHPAYLPCQASCQTKLGRPTLPISAWSNPLLFVRSCGYNDACFYLTPLVLCGAPSITMSKEASQLEATTSAKPAVEERKDRRPLVIIGSVVLFVVIALGLGLGLGLGLKHHRAASSSTTPGSGPSSSPSPSPPLPSPSVLSQTALGTIQPWRRDTLDYSLDMNWDLNASPTTRVYNLTVSEIQAAPDGEPPRPFSHIQ